MPEAEEEEARFDLTRFIQENENFLRDVIGKWAKHSSRRFYGVTIIIVLTICMAGILCFYGKITGETLAGLIGVILGYILGKGGFFD